MNARILVNVIRMIMVTASILIGIGGLPELSVILLWATLTVMQTAVTKQPKLHGC